MTGKCIVCVCVCVCVCLCMCACTCVEVEEGTVNNVCRHFPAAMCLQGDLIYQIQSEIEQQVGCLVQKHVTTMISTESSVSYSSLAI
jgi:hypothetical protein